MSISGGQDKRAQARAALTDPFQSIKTDETPVVVEKVADNGKDKSFLPRFGELAKSAFLVVTAALALWGALRNKA